jgi:hypothetical protein
MAGAFILLAGAGCSSSPGSSGFVGSMLPGDDVVSDAGESDSTTAPAKGDAGQTFALPDGAPLSSTCQAGTYSGAYDGTYQTVVPTTGPVTITLKASTETTGEFDLVTNGGTWDTSWGPSAGDATLPLEQGHATLVGQLDCNADVFTATGQNAYFTVLGQEAGTFTLNLTGKYDPATATISGTFNYASTAGNGSGTWQVTLTD